VSAIHTYTHTRTHAHNRVSILHREKTESERETEKTSAAKRGGKPPRFVIAGIYKQYPTSTRRRGFPKRNMVIRAMAHIDMNDARH